jgi:BMFP domain-containing protein YqiC
MSDQTSLEERLIYLEEDYHQLQQTLQHTQVEMLRLSQRLERLEKKQNSDKDNASPTQSEPENSDWL